MTIHKIADEEGKLRSRLETATPELFKPLMKYTES